MTWSVGMDMGGTFTDGYFTDGRRAVMAKVPTSHFDLTRSVMACLGEGARRFDLDLEDFLASVGVLRLATTIGTNSVVTGAGDPVGLLVEAGAESSLYGPVEPAPAFGVFVHPGQVAAVPASDRTDAGAEAELAVSPADEPLADGLASATDEAVLGLCRDLVSQGVRQVVVSLRRRRRADEERLRELVRDRYPAHYLRSIPLTLGSEVADLDDDELRTATAVLNAYLTRPMAKLLYRTEGLLQQAGLGVPLLAVHSDGSCGRTARTTAISTYSSGPAAGLGLVAAEAAARRDEVAVGFDMGGTTLDLGLVRGGAYSVTETPEIRGVRVSLPVPEVVSVGLGGSSIAAADSAGAVTVGPASAGAVPGPAAFGRGGAEATLTDADAALGFLAAGATLIGDITLDAERARSALAALDGAEAALAGRDPVEAALRVRSAAHRQAASALEDLLDAAAIDPDAVTLYAFGGAGGLHAGPVADLVGIARVRSFVHGGVFSARGVVGAPLRQIYRASVGPGGDSGAAADRLAARARLDLEAERLPLAEARIAIDTDDGQVEVSSQLDPPPVPSVAAAPDQPVGSEPSPPLAAAVGPESSSSPGLGSSSAAARREVWWGAESEPTAVVDLAALAPGETIDGPALIEGWGAVHAVPPGWTARRPDHDSLLWERSP